MSAKACAAFEALRFEQKRLDLSCKGLMYIIPFILARTAYTQRRKAFLPEPATKVAEVFEFCFKGQA